MMCVCGNRICVFGVYGNGALSQSNRKLFTIMLFTHSHTFFWGNKWVSDRKVNMFLLILRRYWMRFF